MTTYLAKAVATTGAQTAIKINSRGAKAPVQVVLAGTGSVQLYGSMNGVTYVTVGSAIIASGVTADVQLYPFMYVNITASNAAVTVMVDAVKG